MTHAYGWSCVSSQVAWSPRDGAQLVSFQDKLFLLGGWNQYAGERADLAGAGTGSFESEVCSEVWCSDDGGNWSLATTAPWSGRHMHGAVVHDGYIWVVGAENGTPDDVWKSKDGVNWELPDLNVFDLGSIDADRFPGGPNNVVGAGQLHGLFFEPDDPDPDRRWKAILGIIRWSRALPGAMELALPGLGSNRFIPLL